MRRPFDIVLVTVCQWFGRFQTFPRSNCVALVFPVLRINEVVGQISIPFVGCRRPVFTKDVPRSLQITYVLAIPFHFQICRQIAFVLNGHASFVRAMDSALPLFLQVVRYVNDCRYQFIFLVRSNNVVVVSRNQAKGGDSRLVKVRDVQRFLPVCRVATRNVSPVRVFPFPFVEIILVRGVMFAFMGGRSVEIISPSPTDNRVGLQAILFYVRTVLPHGRVILVSFLRSNELPFVTSTGYLSFPKESVTRCPMIKFLIDRASCRIAFQDAFCLRYRFLPIRLIKGEGIGVLLHCLRHGITNG